MDFITYQLAVSDLRTNEKYIYHISVKSDSKWAAPSKILEGFFIDYPQYDDASCVIRLSKIHREIKEY